MSADAVRKPSLLARFAPLALIALGLAVFFALDLDRFVSLDALAANRRALAAFVADNVIAAVAAYVVIYALLVAISFPGAGLLTIFGGFLFGLWGTIPTVLAATLGATLVFLAARTALGEGLRARAGGFMARFEQGFREGEFSYLLTMRLIPAFPFWIVNVVPAFLGAKLGKYVLATLIGIIPGSFVYTSIGAGAGAAFDSGGELSLAGVMTRPEVLLPIAGLAALALLPILARALKRPAPAKGDPT